MKMKKIKRKNIVLVRQEEEFQMKWKENVDFQRNEIEMC
jgi:hypothetical protein